MTKHQEAFDALKEALSTAPVLGYPDFFREFILERDASLNGLGTILSQQGKDRTNLCHSICESAHYTPPKDQCTFIVQQNSSC